MDPDRPLNIAESNPNQLYPERIAPRLEALYEAYAQGDGSALLLSVVLASSAGCPAPQWCLPRLTVAANKWQSGELRNVGEVIRMVRPPGWRPVDQEKASEKCRVWLAVTEARLAGAKLNQASENSAFLIAAERFGISEKTAEKHYYEVERGF